MYKPRAVDLKKAWTESQNECGLLTKEPLNRYAAEKAGERFYQIFHSKTGIHPSEVKGRWREWMALSHEDAKSREGFEEFGFCGFLAESICKDSRR